MKSFLCVVRVENNDIHFDVPSIDFVTDQGFSVELIDGDINRESVLLVYEVTLDDHRTIEVTSWENINNSDWSSDLVRLSESYV